MLMSKQKLVVVGNGMAGARAVEEVWRATATGSTL
jgi:NAD(P)H-nitrite reductase large subunit